MASVSGIVTHKRILADFYTLRPKNGQSSWLDAHNAVAVLALPCPLMITYTGIVTLMFMYMPWAPQVAYEGDRQIFLPRCLRPTHGTGRLRAGHRRWRRLHLWSRRPALTGVWCTYGGALVLIGVPCRWQTQPASS